MESNLVFCEEFVVRGNHLPLSSDVLVNRRLEQGQVPGACAKPQIAVLIPHGSVAAAFQHQRNSVGVCSWSDHEVALQLSFLVAVVDKVHARINVVIPDLGKRRYIRVPFCWI